MSCATRKLPFRIGKRCPRSQAGAAQKPETAEFTVFVRIMRARCAHLVHWSVQYTCGLLAPDWVTWDWDWMTFAQHRRQEACWPKANTNVAWGNAPGVRNDNNRVGRRPTSACHRGPDEYGLRPKEARAQRQPWGVAPGYGDRRPSAKQIFGLRALARAVLLTSNIVNFSTMFSDRDSVELLKDYILCVQ